MAGLIRDSSGNLYGTAAGGGAHGGGVVYKIDPDGNQTVLYNFTGGADGAGPSGVIGDGAGNLYGTAGGGASNQGVVFKLNASGETVLYSFTGGADGGSPGAGVILDSAGNVYGTTTWGGVNGVGVVFKISPTGQETVLHAFTGGTDGGNPQSGSGLVLDSQGNLYGTTCFDGASRFGVVFKVDAKDGGLTPLYTFTGKEDGACPAGGLIRDPQGNLYGTAEYAGSYGRGVIYRISATGQQTVLYSFAGGTGGESPGPLSADGSGNFFGVAAGGRAGFGVLYKLNAHGYTVLYNFTKGADGGNPSGTIIRDSAGNFYGTAPNGGVGSATGPGLGVVFKVSPTGSETPIYTFPASPDGYNPFAGVIGDGMGNLYGTTRYGGTADAGVVYKFDATGETILHTFTGGADGGFPTAGVIRDGSGNLYGVAAAGGVDNNGVVYKIDSAGQFTVLHTFNGRDGASPVGNLFLDSAGNLYGATMFGGYGGGVIYRLSARGEQTLLQAFPDQNNGGPNSGLTPDAQGNLYGTLYSGKIYKISPSGYSVVYTLPVVGGPPQGVTIDAAGNLYGVVSIVGNQPQTGIVFTVSASGQFSVLHTFNGSPNGWLPVPGIIGDSSGNLYGMTGGEETTDAGLVFQLNSSGETVLHRFTGDLDGRYPAAGPIRDWAGNLYGTTAFGGPKGGGVIFQLKKPQ